jgi:hypothetical protein
MGPSDQLMTNSGGWHSFLAVSSEKARTRKPRPCKHFHSKAGDRIRTDDVQLGKPNTRSTSSERRLLPVLLTVTTVALF